MTRFLRENVYAAGIILLLRLYLGWNWLSSGWGKLMNGFDASGFLNNAVTKPVIDRATNEAIYPTYTAFISNFALPNVKIINILIPIGEFLVGLGLILGGLTLAATFFGMLMNFMFLLAGTVSTNPWMLMISFIIFLSASNAGRFGLDHFLRPYLSKWFGGKKAYSSS